SVTVLVALPLLPCSRVGGAAEVSSLAGTGLHGCASLPGSLLCHPDFSSSQTRCAAPGVTLKLAWPLASVNCDVSPVSSAPFPSASRKTVQFASPLSTPSLLPFAF